MSPPPAEPDALSASFPSAAQMPSPERFAPAWTEGVTADGRVLVRFEALGVMDAADTFASPGAVLIEFHEPSPHQHGRWAARVLASGRLLDVALHESRCAVIRLPRHVLVPGLINAHTHLDLTHVGPRPHDPELGFAAWIRTIAPARAEHEHQVRASVRQGVALAIRGGTVAVGDIAGALARVANLCAFDALGHSGLAGVSFLEFFAAGAREQAGLDGLEQALALAHLRAHAAPQHALTPTLRLGLQPHAPYSVSLRGYQRAIESAAAFTPPLPVATHLSESLDERRLCMSGDGPLRDFLANIGVWNAELASTFGRGGSSVARLDDAGVLKHLTLCAHVNDASDDDLRRLAKTGASVVYCPRAWAYFGHDRDLGTHRWHDLLRAGVNVALGTDSVINLPSNVDTLGISVLDEMRSLARASSERADTISLERTRQFLGMGTVNGARALGLPTAAFELRVGSLLAGLVAVQVVEHLLRPPNSVPANALGAMFLGEPAIGVKEHPEILFGGTFFGLTGTDSDLVRPSA